MPRSCSRGSMAEGRPVYLSGLGVVSPSGTALDGFWSALGSGASGGREAPFDTSSTRCRTVASVEDFKARDFIAPAKVRRMDLVSRFAVAATRRSLEDAGFESPPADPDRWGVVLGTSTAGAGPVREFLEPVLMQGPAGALPMVFPNTVGNAPASQVAIQLGFGGPNSTICQKEASGLAAIATAAGFVEEGRADVMVGGGGDAVVESFFRVFDRLGVMAGPQSEHPWVEGTEGFIMGEGAYVVLLTARPSDIVLAGYCSRSDTVTRERWPRDPRVLAEAIGGALASAGVEPGAVDLVVGAANGSAALESFESAALARVFSDGVPPVTGVKRLTGEAGGMAAAGVVAGALAIRSGTVFPGLGAAEPVRRGLAFQPIRRAERTDVDVVLVTAVASGGAVAAMVLKRER